MSVAPSRGRFIEAQKGEEGKGELDSIPPT
jgi:hypothetical protein